MSQIRKKRFAILTRAIPKCIRFHSYFKIHKTIIIFLITLLILACEIWGNLDNAVDPDSPSYQGYETVDDPEKIELLIPEDGQMLSHFGPVKWTPASDIEEYHVQISEDPSFVEIDLEKFDFDVNEVNFSIHSLESGTYYWRVRAKKKTSLGGLDRFSHLRVICECITHISSQRFYRRYTDTCAQLG
jgi:hypothetical protein